MAWAIITKNFEYSRPGKNVSFTVFALEKAQQLPHDVVAYAVGKSFGKEVDPPTKDDAAAAGGIDSKIRSKRRT